MPDSSVNAYLAKHYLDGAKAEAILAREGGERKKKRKKIKPDDNIGSGFKLVDEADETWRQSIDEIDEDVLIVKDESTNQNGKRSNRWNKLGGREEEEPDELPLVTEENLSIPQAGPSTSKIAPIRAGLKTREEMRSERLERERKEAEEKALGQQSSKEEQKEALRQSERDRHQQETIYRDASGRKINVRKEEEERRKKREEERKLDREKKDWNKGQIQLQKIQEQRKREEEERNTSFARHADDVKMNKELRDVRRENDPAAIFLKKKESEKESSSRKPTYKGSFPPNRFGIRPGYRWDGVERSNGFENKLFQRRNERVRRKAEHQAWSQEDM